MEWLRQFWGDGRGEKPPKSISKSSLNQVGILIFLANEKKNSLQQFDKQLDIFGNLAKSSPSTRIYMHARSNLASQLSGVAAIHSALSRARGNTLLLHFDWPADGIGNTLLLVPCCSLS